MSSDNKSTGRVLLQPTSVKESRLFPFARCFRRWQLGLSTSDATPSISWGEASFLRFLGSRTHHLVFLYLCCGCQLLIFHGWTLGLLGTWQSLRGGHGHFFVCWRAIDHNGGYLGNMTHQALPSGHSSWIPNKDSFMHQNTHIVFRWYNAHSFSCGSRLSNAKASSKLVSNPTVRCLPGRHLSSHPTRHRMLSAKPRTACQFLLVETLSTPPMAQVPCGIACSRRGRNLEKWNPRGPWGCRVDG
ncbi:hypothetical protein BO78DRAFT_29900 [Aspergillus sclerotiicarbonarius CBS 121057]|uniref:Uncharacterized protein n=1 Tax=Aspergillus sclerotiicarbonarius (strain CBS 121057 / IBT 28362) TaxID=1448318 RepID=A0A319F6G7_ASPSB|nr:hypothetical protein BO78DRAFT_29900 [Aspergillus sclerotiicarbonarius CBS 121057]